MNKVDFFIVGAPKCGTTSLHNYLSSHPEIEFPIPKDIHTFGKDLYIEMTKKEHEKILSKSVRKSNVVIGESAVYYLYSNRAAKEIYKYNRYAKIIIIVRNPVDLIYSLHSQLVLSRIELESDFRKAYKTELARKKSKKNYFGKKYTYYSDIVKFSGQIKRYYKLFGKENVKVIIFEEFVYNLDSTYKEILEFLGVKDINFKPKFSKYNQNKDVRSEYLQQFILYLPPMLNRVVKKYIPFRVRNGIFKILLNLNTYEKERDTLDSNFREKLVKDFRGVKNNMEKLLGYRLPYWN